METLHDRADPRNRNRACEYCGAALPPSARRHARFCSPAHRRAAHRAHTRKAASRPQDPRILRACRLLADNVSLDRAWAEINGNRPTPDATIEALVYSLRRGAAELSKPDTLRRLSELDKAQLKAICRHLQNFNPEIAPPWPPEDVAALIAKWRELHG